MNRIRVNIAEQRLWVDSPTGNSLFTARVSTGKNGVGQQMDSGCTPLGKHRIRAKIGDGVPLNGVFKGRRFRGEVYTPELATQFPDRDWILTRILWLCGNEVGHNRLGNVDTMQRYIYIHGTPDSREMGKPHSHGCITLHSDDMMALYDCVDVGTIVEIHAN